MELQKFKCDFIVGLHPPTHFALLPTKRKKEKLESQCKVYTQMHFLDFFLFGLNKNECIQPKVDVRYIAHKLMQNANYILQQSYGILIFSRGHIGTRISSLETKKLINSDLDLKFSTFSMARNYSKASQSLYILRRLLKFDKISKFNFELLTSIKKKVQAFCHICVAFSKYMNFISFAEI